MRPASIQVILLNRSGCEFPGCTGASDAVGVIKAQHRVLFHITMSKSTWKRMSPMEHTDMVLEPTAHKAVNLSPLGLLRLGS